MTNSGSRPAVPGIQEVAANGNRIEFRREGGPVESYVNDPKGLEQGFAIESPPGFPIRRSEPAIGLAVRGDLVPGMMADGETIEFLSESGVGLIHYGKPEARDAEGRKLPPRMQLANASGLSALRPSQFVLHIRVDASGAAHPITIGPLTTSAAWTAESNQACALFGYSVATAGDVNGDGYSDVIVGAYACDNGEESEGRAYVYHGPLAPATFVEEWRQSK